MRARTLIMIALCSLLTLPLAAGERNQVEVVAIGEVLDSFHHAAATADGELYFSLFAHAAVFMGTDVTERWSVDQFKAFAEPYFSEGRGWTYIVKQRQITVAPGAATAWFDEILWNQSYGTCRGSGVLVRTEHGWRIAQYHLTIPIPNDLAAAVVRSIRAHESGAEPAPAEQPLVVLLVRHAERVDESPDAKLSVAGRKRAQRLAEVLRDAGIESIHSTDFARTRATAAPLADHLGLELELYDPNQLADLSTQLGERGGRHLVVGHSDTIPETVEALAGEPGPEIGTDEHDRLYILTRSPDGTVSTTLMRYGERSTVSSPSPARDCHP